MTVQELIEELKAMPPDHDVFLSVFCDPMEQPIEAEIFAVDLFIDDSPDPLPPCVILSANTEACRESEPS